MFKLTFALGLVLSFQFAQAETHIRLWRGFRQDTSTAADFKNHVAGRLVPATVAVGKDKGLVSYMPVFLTADEAKPVFVPDEIAIIQYENEATYKVLASTPEFSAYGKMHYEEGAFTKKNKAGFGSGSLVSQALADETKIDLKKASAINYGDVDTTWKTEQVQLNVVLLKDSTEEKSECLQSLISNLKNLVQIDALKGFVLAYDPQYILIYAKGASSVTFSDSTICRQESSIQLKNQAGFDEQTDGVNISF